MVVRIFTSNLNLPYSGDQLADQNLNAIKVLRNFLWFSELLAGKHHLHSRMHWPIHDQ